MINRVTVSLILISCSFSACSSISIYPTRVPTLGNSPKTNITVNLDNAVPTASEVYCAILPSAAGTTFTLNGTGSTFTATADIISTNQIVCNGIPNVVAPGPGVLQISFHYQNTTNVVSTDITYFTPVDFAVSKRPYIYETSGDILLRFDPQYFKTTEGFKITADLPAGGPKAKWEWNINSSCNIFATFPNVILPLPFLSTLPPNTESIHNDMSVTVTRLLDGTKYVRSRRFHRVPPPSLDNSVIPVQVDHTKKALLVGGQSFVMQGYYMGTDHPTNDSFWLQHELNVIKQKLVPNGLNVGMLYDLQNEPLNVQLQFLDGCHRAGFKVIYPVSHIGKIDINHGGPFNNKTLLKELIANITFVKDHPALLGYEICDDCCSTTPFTSIQSQVYQLIKNIDPYHVTIGAVNCGDGWPFSDTSPSWLTPDEGILSMRNIPEAVQPNLQLSLDVIMQENYNWRLSSHEDNGTWSGGVANDGFYRHGIEFEPLVNCPGTWLPDKFTDPNVQFLSLQWLALITAEMRDSVAFILTLDYQYLIPQSGLFSKGVTLLSKALMAPFGSVIHPLVYPTVDKVGNNVRTRGWSVPKTVNNTNEDCSGFVVVVNINETSLVNFEVNIVDEKKHLLPCNATRMFDGKDIVLKVGSDGILSDHVQPADTNVYCLVKV